MIPQVLLPWERLLWSGRPWRLSSRLAGERYLLTDFRLLRVTRGGAVRSAGHGARAEARGWRMPAVAALPQPDVRERGWEIYKTNIDAQMRNAIYGYLAESDNQAKAAYMREVVVPGMSRVLHRPAYDFTQSYEYNRSRRALGCYHCHQVQ